MQDALDESITYLILRTCRKMMLYESTLIVDTEHAKDLKEGDLIDAPAIYVKERGEKRTSASQS